VYERENYRDLGTEVAIKGEKQINPQKTFEIV
jgi:hypothetical protein